MFRVSFNTLIMTISTRGLEFITTHKRNLRRLCFYTCLSVILFRGGLHPGGSASRGVSASGGVCIQGVSESRERSASRVVGQTPPWSDTMQCCQRAGGRNALLFLHGCDPGCNEHFTNRCLIYPCTYILFGEDAFSSVVQRSGASRMFAITFQKVMLNGLIPSVPPRP